MKIGKIIEEHKVSYILSANDKEFSAKIRGAFFQDGIFPKVGDKVKFSSLENGQVVIEEILPRKNVIVRRAAHTGKVQELVANVDYIFIVMGVDNDFNLNRLDRYVTLARQNSIPAVIILNKMDIDFEVDKKFQQVKKLFPEIDVMLISAVTGEGVDGLQKFFINERTAVLLGSSGVGKSTLVNQLKGNNQQVVGGLRKGDGRGRHTTTTRQLLKLANGGFIIDTPGMRELGMIIDHTNEKEQLINSIEMIGRDCQFSNCDHEKSSGCAVRIKVLSGEISERQLVSYLKLKSEINDNNKNAKINTKGRRRGL